MNHVILYLTAVGEEISNCPPNYCGTQHTTRQVGSGADVLGLPRTRDQDSDQTTRRGRKVSHLLHNQPIQD